MHLFDRARELDALHAAFTESADGNGRLVLVSGGPGSGKTRLVHEFLASLDPHTARILPATASPAGRDQPLGVVLSLLHEAGTPLPAPDTGPAESLSPGPLPPAGPRERPVSPHRVRALTDTLLGLTADGRTLVLAVDDAHLTDPGSLEVLLRLAHGIRFKRVLLVCALSGQSDSPDSPGALASPAQGRLLRQPHQRVRLAPLSPEGLRELLTAQTGGPADPELVRSHHRATGGNPLLVHALLDDRACHAVEAGRPATGVHYRQAVLSLLHRGGPVALRVARALAANAAPAPTDTLARLADADPADVDAALEWLHATGLAHDRVLRTPAAAGAVLADTPPEARSRLHARVAESRYLAGAPTTEVAPHLRAADRVPAGWGAELLRNAADQALAADDVDACTAYLRLLLRTGTDAAERRSLAAALGRAEWRANPAAAGPHLDPLREPALAGELDMRDTATVLRHLLWQGDTELAAKTVAGLLPAHTPADTRALAEAEFVRQWFYGASMPARTASASLLAADRRGVTRASSGLTARLAELMGGDATDEAVAAVAQAFQGHHLDHLDLEMVAMALLAIAHSDRPAIAAAACEALLATAADRGATTWRALLGAVRAEIALLQGDMTTAARESRAALELMHAQSWGVLIGLPLSTAVFALTARGRHEEAEALLAREVPEPMFRTVFGIQYLRARGGHRLATDRPFAALNDFETCGRLMREGNPHLQKGIPWRSDLALANLRIGKTRTAREWAEEQLRLPDAHSSRARAMALRMLAATGRPHRRTALLREAADLFKACGDRHSLAQCYADLSAAHYELGEYDRARLVARKAAREAEACGVESPVDAHLLAEPGRPEPDGAPAGAPILSDAEVRVAGLAALGYTNREIAGRLHVTVSTVEQHLTRVYRKLDVASRAELPSKMLDRHIPKLSDRWADTHPSAG
ncbi:AAA family ATPase (plasmid) [Streptomyces sp. BI20]|uniref:AAA family ATPase n=1 Tax=Streptomyces sp. BI20 TaxID=3403460 RepID=UPI003C7897D0